MERIIKNTSSKTNLLFYESVGIDGLAARYNFSKLVNQSKRKQVYNRAHEWCAGHGAIGFQLLEDKHCRHLVLSDINELATVGCHFTAAANDLEDQVTVYTISKLQEIDKTERWDLFVANPPWRDTLMAVDQDLARNWICKLYDFDWLIHKNLWANLGSYTTDDVDVFLFEDGQYSSPDTWKKEIAEAGFKLHAVHNGFMSATGYVMHLIKG